MIFDHDTFMWICSGLTAGAAVPWGIVEIVLLKRALGKEGPKGHDARFGAVIGLTISILGITGVLKYHLGG